MKLKYRIAISILLVLSLMFVFVGCSGNQTPENNADPSQNNNDIDITTEPVQSENPSEVDNEEVEAVDIGEAFPGAAYKPVEADKLNKAKEDVNTLNTIEMALVGDNLAGYKILVDPKGYGGPMEVFTYIDNEGNIAKVEVGNNGETVGVGDAVSFPKFLNQFIGINDETAVSGVDAVAGATFSTGAVMDGVKRAIKVYQNHLK